MKRRAHATPHYATRGYRLASGAFGAFLIGLGLYALFAVRPLDALQIVGCVGLLAVGGNLGRCAWTGKEPWISKIGPLP